MNSRTMTLVVILAMLVGGSAVMAKGHGNHARGAAGMGMHTRSVYAEAKHDSALGLDKFTMWLDKAGLKKELDGKGDFTVFAPNDNAINTMGSSDSMAMWSKKGSAMTSSVKYYVLTGRRLMAADLMKMDGQNLTMDNGQSLPVKVMNGKVMVGNANVVDADHTGSNGVIHVIDAPLMMAKTMGMTPMPMSTPMPMGTTPETTQDSTMNPQTNPYGK